MLTPTQTAQQIKARQTSSDIFKANPRQAQNTRSLTPNVRTSNTFRDSSVIAYKDPHTHVETAASRKDFGIPRNTEREQNLTFKSGVLKDQLPVPDNNRYASDKITRQVDPRFINNADITSRILDTRGDSVPDAFVDEASRVDYYRDKQLSRTPERQALSNKISLRHIKLEHQWDADRKIIPRVTKEDDFRPNFPEYSPREQRQHALYGEEALRQSPPRGNATERVSRQEMIEDTPSAKQKFVNSKRQNENISHIFPHSAEQQRSRTPNVLTKKDPNLEICPVDVKWTDKLTENKYKNYSEPFERMSTPNVASERRAFEYSSNIFNQPESQRRVARSPSPINGAGPDFGDHKNESIRRKEHNFSDILNLTNYENAGKREKKAESIPTNVEFTDSAYEGIGSRHKTPNDYYDIKVMKKAEQASSLDTENVRRQADRPVEARVERPNKGALVNFGAEFAAGNVNVRGEQIVTHPENPDHTKNMLKTFDLSALPKTVDDRMIKRLFSGFHIVDLKRDTNRLSNQPVGTGEVKIRSEDTQAVQKLQQKLMKIGIFMVDKDTHVGRKNNFTENPTVEWYDKNLQREEKRLEQSPKHSAKQAKRIDLQSQGEMYGNSHGHGKWNQNWESETNTQITPKNDYHSTAHWDSNMKKTPLRRKQPGTAAPRTTWK